MPGASTPTSSASTRPRNGPAACAIASAGRVRALRLGRPSPGTFTQIALEVDDLDAVVAVLKRRGVEFEDVDVPGLKTVDGIAEVEGNYPSKDSRGERAAWFRDSEGNLLGLGEPLR